jgi:hypothetical protein
MDFEEKWILESFVGRPGKMPASRLPLQARGTLQKKKKKKKKKTKLIKQNGKNKERNST